MAASAHACRTDGNDRAWPLEFGQHRSTHDASDSAMTSRARTAGGVAAFAPWPRVILLPEVSLPLVVLPRLLPLPTHARLAVGCQRRATLGAKATRLLVTLTCFPAQHGQPQIDAAQFESTMADSVVGGSGDIGTTTTV